MQRIDMGVEGLRQRERGPQGAGGTGGVGKRDKNGSDGHVVVLLRPERPLDNAPHSGIFMTFSILNMGVFRRPDKGGKG